MSDVALAQPPAAADPAANKILRIAAWLVGILVILVALRLAGIDVWGWFEQLWDTVTDISLGYVILGCLFQGAQTVLTALGWYGILRYAYPGGVNVHDGARVLRDRRRAQQRRPREPRHVRDAAHVRRRGQRRDVPGNPGRLRGPEDLLPHRRDAHLPLPVLAGRRLVRVPVRERARRHLEPPRPDAVDHRRRDLPPRPPAADLLDTG